MPERSTPDAEFLIVAKALGNGHRVAIIRTLEKVDRLSATSYSKASELPVQNGSYHLRQLHAAGIVEVVDTLPARGSAEVFYGLGGPRADLALAMLYAGTDPRTTKSPPPRSRGRRA